MADYIPSGNDQFSLWAANFMQKTNDKGSQFGLTPEEITELANVLTQWQTLYDTQMAQQASLQQTRQSAKAVRKTLEASLRSVAQRFQNHPKVTDADRVDFGLRVPDPNRTSSGVPQTAPMMRADLSHSFEHIIHIADEQYPLRRGKPKGVMACEIWVKLGGPSSKDPNEFTLLTTAPSSPYIAKYNVSDAGQMAHYLLRWVTNQQEYGPWSQVYSFTIPG